MMHQSLARKISLFFLITLFLSSVWIKYDPLQAGDRTKLSIQMDKRLQEIIDQKTQDMLNRLIVQEEYLTKVIQGLNREIKLRKDEGIIIDVSKFDLIFGIDQSLVTKYEDELTTIVRMIDELNTLKKTAEGTTDYESTAKIEQLQSRLKNILENTDLKQTGTYSQQLANYLITDYSKELQRLMKILSELETYKDREEYLPQIEQLEKQITSAFTINNLMIEDKKDSTAVSATNPVVEDYVQELIKIVDILRQLDALDARLPSELLETHFEIKRIKNSILAVVDRKALLSLGYDNVATMSDEKRMDVYFDEWKASQTLWIHAKEKQVEMLQNYLIESGMRKQIDRMFHWDIIQAVDAYNRANHKLASRLFENILLHYPYKKMDDIRYYLAECYFIQLQYVDAKKIYQQIVDQNIDAEFVKKAVWRLLLISESLHSYSDFFRYAEKMIHLYDSKEKDLLFEKTVFYSGYIAFRLGDFKKSLEFLSRISEQSTFYLPGRFVAAVDNINMDRMDEAVSILTFLSNRELYLGQNESNIAIYNQALLKMGLIDYNNDDLQAALQKLQQVDPAIPDFDVVLLSRAWTHFRLGHLQSASNDLDLLFWNYLTSNYTYEAMMLAAHCNRLSGKIKSSIRQVRYVENAQVAKEMEDEYNLERQKINQLLTEVDDIEEKVVTERDAFSYERLLEIRNNLEEALQGMNYKGEPGLYLAQEYENEQQRIIDVIVELQDVSNMAQTLGKTKIEKNANQNIQKLKSKLLTIQKYQNIKQVDVLADYPLAQKESDENFQKQKLDRMKQETTEEQNKLKQYRQEIVRLTAEAKNTSKTDALAQLEYQDIEVNQLQKKLEKLSVYFAEKKIEPLETDYRKWADFSGFGMSDLDFVRMKTIEKTILNYNDNISAINSAIKKKESDIQENLAAMETRITELEQSILKKNIEEEKSKREHYFTDEYFVNRTSEVDQQMKQSDIVPEKPSLKNPDQEN